MNPNHRIAFSRSPDTASRIASSVIHAMWDFCSIQPIAVIDRLNCASLSRADTIVNPSPSRCRHQDSALNKVSLVIVAFPVEYPRAGPWSRTRQEPRQYLGCGPRRMTRSRQGPVNPCQPFPYHSHQRGRIAPWPVAQPTPRLPIIRGGRAYDLAACYCSRGL